MSIVKNEPKYKNGLLQAIREQLSTGPTGCICCATRQVSGALTGRSLANLPFAAAVWIMAQSM